MPDLPILLFTLGATPFFASRSFSAMFWVAAAARLQAEGLLAFTEGLGPMQLNLALQFPGLLIANEVLLVLLVLALLESLADKSTGLRLMLAELDPWTKVAGDYIFNNVALAASVSLVAAEGLRQAGLGGALWTVVPAAGVWLIATLRRNVLSFLTDLDEDDDLGIRKLISWAEDG